jgi:hypothetical protein
VAWILLTNGLGKGGGGWTNAESGTDRARLDQALGVIEGVGENNKGGSVDFNFTIIGTRPQRTRI